MSLAPIPPWESVSPLDFTNAMSQGAKLGLERANLETQAIDAANRLRLGYAQLAGENARVSAAHQLNAAQRADALTQWMAEHEMRQRNQDIANQRESREANEAASRQKYREDTLNLKKNPPARPMNASGGLYVYNPDGTLKTLKAPPDRIDPLDRMDYDFALKNQHEAQQTLARGGLSAKDKEFWTGRLDEWANVLKKIRSKYGGDTGESPSGASLLENMTPGQSPVGGPAWSTPVPSIGDSLTAPQSPLDSAIDFGQPTADQVPAEVRVLNIRPKQ